MGKTSQMNNEENSTDSYFESFYVTAFTDINICLFKVLPFYFHIVTGLI